MWVTPVGTASLEPRSAGGGGTVAKAAAQGDRGRGGKDQEAGDGGSNPRPGGRLGSGRDGIQAGGCWHGRGRGGGDGGGQRLAVGQAELDQLHAQAIEALMPIADAGRTRTA